MASTKREHDFGKDEEGDGDRCAEVTVSVLLPGEDSSKYLLRRAGARGWWLPFGTVQPNERIKIAAQRVATEVSIASLNTD